MEESISLGQFSIPFILSVVLGLFYKVFGKYIMSDRWKAPISCGIGIVLGIVGLIYNESPWNAKNIIDAVLYGFMVGASAVGIYESQRSITNPRQ